MKLTVQVPDAIIDNTKSEQIVELVTKASQSLDISGSILVSAGAGNYDIYQINTLTASLIHSVNTSTPLGNISSDPLRPNIAVTQPIPAVSGGTGLSSLASGTILVADSPTTFAQTSGSTFLNRHLSAGDNIGLSVVGDAVKVALSSSLTGLGSVSASSFTGSGASLTNLTASQIGGLFQYIQNSITGSGSITVDNNGTASLNPNVTASNYSASGYYYGDGRHLTNIASTAVAGVVKYLSASSPLSASVDANGTGSIALMSQSVNYNGVTVNLGQSGSIPLVQSIITGSNNLTATSSSLSGAVTIVLASRLQNLTDVTASYFTGSFKGDGTGLTGVVTNIYTSGSITGSGLTAGNPLRLKDTVNVTTLSASYAEISGGLSVGDYVQLLPVGAVNIPTNTTASYIYTSGSTNDMYFTQYQGEFTNTTRLRWLESALNTGLLHGGVVTTQNGTNKFSVTAGSGLIVKFNASTGSDPYPTINFVTWPAVTSASLQYSSSDSITYISIKPTDANKTIGEVRETTTAPTFSEFKDYIILGRVLHQSGAVTNGAINTPATAYGVNSNVADFVRAIGPLKINGHILSPSGSATLALTKTTGDSYVEGRNYSANPNIPNIITSGSDLPVTTTKIYYEHISGSKAIINNGIAGAGHAILTASLYQDTNGNLSAVGNSEFSVQRVFWFPRAVNNALFVYYGQAKYSNYDDAVAGISTETFVEADNTKTSAILVAYIVLRGNAANFTDPKVAKIFQAGLFRGGAGGGGGGVGAGATNLASLIDVEVGSQTDGQALVYNGTKWANGTPHNALTASIANTASYLSGFDKNDYVTTASFNTFSGSYMTGSFTGSLTGSLYGTASYADDALSSSYADNALTASYATTASYADNALTASYATTASYADNALTASYASNALTASFATTASYADNALTASFATTASYADDALSASYATTASYADDALTASYATSAQASLTASYVNTLSQSVYISGNLSASDGLSGSFYGDGSQITGVLTSSFATSSLTASYVNPLTQSVYVIGDISASSGITGSFSGSGLSLQITASQITGLSAYLNSSITGSSNITVSNGTASLNQNISVTDLSASHITASNITASNIVKAAYLYGNGAHITSLDLTHVSGVLTTDHGGTGLSSFTSGALYIASSTSTLAPFTGSDFQLIAWDSGNSRWNPYSQPYDVAGEISGSYSSGSTVLSFKIPRNMTFTGVVSSIPNFVYRINGADFTPSSVRTASANEVLTVVASSASANQYFTLLGQLR